MSNDEQPEIKITVGELAPAPAFTLGFDNVQRQIMLILNQPARMVLYMDAEEALQVLGMLEGQREQLQQWAQQAQVKPTSRPPSPIRSAGWPRSW